MAVQGVFTSDANIVGSRPGDFAAGILKINPTGSAPMFALTAGMPSAPATDSIINWFEETKITGRTGVASFTTDGDGVGITLDDGTSYVTGTILLVQETGELLFVDSISGNTVTVTRGFAGTTATTITTSHNVQQIGTAHEEGSSRPVAVANLGVARYNLCQIFRNAWDVTGTAKVVQYHTGSIVAKNKADAANFHAENIETALIYGKKHQGTLNSKPFRTMDGLNTQISTNITTAGATTTWTQLQAFFQTVFSKNIAGKPNERIAFCGNTALAVINSIALLNATMNIAVGQTDFGLKVTNLITPFGDIKLMTHPLMVDNPVWTQELYVYHPGAIRMRYLRKTFVDAYDDDGTRAGIDSDFGVFTTEVSVEYRAELTGGQLLDLDAGAAG